MIRVLLRFAACTLCTLMAFALFAYGLENECFFFQRWMRMRASEAFAELDVILQRQDHVALFLGASDVESGIDPLAIEHALQAQGQDLKVYNFGLRSSSPADGLLAEHLKDIFQENHKQADVILLKLAPMLLTNRANINLRQGQVRADLAGTLYRWRDFRRDIWEEPLSGVRQLVEHYILGGMDLNSVSYYLLIALNRVLPNIYCPGILQARDPETRLWRDPRFLSSPAWNADEHGNYFWNIHGPDAVFQEISDRLATESEKQIMIGRWDDTYDVRRFNFSPVRVRELKASLAALGEISHRIIVYYIFEHPQVDYTPEAEAHLTALLNELAQIPKVQILDLRTGPSRFNAEEYLEPAHFNLKGRQKLTELFTHELSKDFP
jgi:hypothetical protein